MRIKKIRLELLIIRERRSRLLQVLVWLFPKSFNAFASAHLNRAHEVSEIGNDALHSISHYVGADCGLPGYGSKKEPTC